MLVRETEVAGNDVASGVHIGSDLILHANVLNDKVVGISWYR